VAFNIDAVVMAVLQASHPEKVIKDEVSAYYIAYVMFDFSCDQSLKLEV